MTIDKSTILGYIIIMAKSRKNNWEDIFRVAIEKSDLTLKELGKRSKVDVSQLSRFMREERGLSIKTAEKVAKVVGIELKEIRK